MNYAVENNHWVAQLGIDKSFRIDYCPFCGIKLPIMNKNQSDLFKKYQDFIKDLSYNHDHDEDAHRYNSWCYICEAEELVGKS